MKLREHRTKRLRRIMPVLGIHSQFSNSKAKRSYVALLQLETDGLSFRLGMIIAIPEDFDWYRLLILANREAV
jgi:hypothetical protein